MARQEGFRRRMGAVECGFSLRVYSCELRLTPFTQYLQLVPPSAKPKPAPAPARRAPPTAPTPVQASRTADSNSQPVSVMPGMGNGGGLAAILAAKRAAAVAEESGSSGASTPATSRPGSGMGSSLFPSASSLPDSLFVGKPLAPKPGAKPPTVGPKPGAKPVVPNGGGARTAPPPPSGGRAPAAPGRVLGGGVAKPPGQMDLAAALAKRAGRQAE